MIVKRIFLILPLLIALVFLLSFLAARPYFDKQANQLIYSLPQEPDYLNPVISTSLYASIVEGLIFGSLLKYNADLELEGDIAAGFTIRQESFFFPDPSRGLTAQAAADALKKKLADETFKKNKIVSAEAVSPDRVKVFLDTAGKDFQKSIFSVIDKDKLRPIFKMTILLYRGKRFPGGKKVATDAFIELIKEKIADMPEVNKGLIDFDIDSSETFAILFHGDKDGWEQIIKPLLAEGGEKAEEIGKIASTESSYFVDRPILTFKLRRDVLWHDGEKLTSKDVLFTYRLFMDEKTNTVRRPDYEPIKKIEIPDDYTVKVIYKYPFSPSIAVWSYTAIMPEHILGEVLKDNDKDINTSDFNRHPVGTGPFVFDKWVTDEKVVLKANERYYEGRPYLDRISFRIAPDPFVAEYAFLRGETDIFQPRASMMKRLQENKEIDTYSRYTGDYGYIGWQLKNPLFKDKRIRRALCLAVNREEIVKYATYGQGFVSSGPYSAQFWYGNPDVKPLPYDPQKAKELLEEAGWKDRDGDGILENEEGEKFEFTLLGTAGGSPFIPVLVKDNLKKAGVKVNINLLEWTVFLNQHVHKHEFDAISIGWALGVVEPDQYQIWHSSQTAVGQGFNVIDYSYPETDKNPEVDKLLVQGRTEFDRAKRQKIYRKLHKLIYEDQPYLFLVSSKDLYAMHHGEFRVRRKDRSGNVIDEPVKMTKAGLLYYINYWYRTDTGVPE